MEEYPFKPFESPEQSEPTGEDAAYKKKKKKTTRFPLPIVTSEPTVDAQAPITEQKPESVLEELFAREAEPEESSVATEESLVNPETESELALESAAASDYEPMPDIESEFSSEAPIIITKAEVPTTPESKLETVMTVVEEPKTIELEPQPVSAEPGQSSGLTREALETEAASLFQPPETLRPDIEAEPMPEYALDPMPEAERQVMFDPSAAVIERSTLSPSGRPSIEQADAVYRAERRGVRRGVVSGALFGWWLGRRGKRQAQHSAEVALKSRDKEIKKLTTEHELAAERLTAMERTESTLLKLTEKPQSGIIESASSISQPEVMKQKIEAKSVAPPPPEEVAISEATYAVGDDKRVETSAWHRYEVDKKTGKLIEQPEVAYGQEFLKETRQEKLQREVAEPQIAAQAGQTVLHANDQTVAKPAVQATTNTSVSPQSLSQSPRASFAKNQIVRGTKSPLTWIVAFAIVVVLFIAGALG